MDKNDGRASFEDMARVVLKYGFKAQGFAASWEQLTKLKMPVIVYLKYQKDDHFSVLRGIGGRTVWLADPSLGNRTYSREQFLAMWETHDINDIHNKLRGKFLAVLPIKADIHPADDFFTMTPRRQSTQAVEQYTINGIP
jgi:predicted double-glycine peptidase